MSSSTWFWEAPGAPHAYLDLAFAARSSEMLRVALVEWLPGEFRLRKSSRSEPLWETPRSGEGGYVFVSVGERTLGIERGWGGRGKADSRLVRRLLDVPELVLEGWRVHEGGEGYAETYIASGTDRQSLERYISGEVEEDDLSDVLRQLRILLAARELHTKYTVDNPTLFSGRTVIPLLYEVVRVRNAVISNPAGGEIFALARDLSDACRVRTSASASWPQDARGDFVGGSISVTFRSR